VNETKFVMETTSPYFRLRLAEVGLLISYYPTFAGKRGPNEGHHFSNPVLTIVPERS
jgi:hypothetical protein